MAARFHMPISLCWVGAMTAFSTFLTPFGPLLTHTLRIKAACFPHVAARCIPSSRLLWVIDPDHAFPGTLHVPGARGRAGLVVRHIGTNRAMDLPSCRCGWEERDAVDRIRHFTHGVQCSRHRLAHRAADDAKVAAAESAGF